MKTELIAKYDGYNLLDSYTIEAFWEDKETDLSKEDFIDKYEYSDEYYDAVCNYLNYTWEEVWNYTVEEADKILDSKYYVSVDGRNRGWRGTQEVDLVIKETTLDAIISKYMEPDKLIVEVYPDRVEVQNIHHDGTNSYIFKPFDYSDLTKKELLQRVDKEGYEWYGDKLYKATKDDLINYIEDNLEWNIEYTARTTETNSSKNSRQMKSAIIGW